MKEYTLELDTTEAYLLRVYTEANMEGGVAHAKNALRHNKGLTKAFKEECNAHLSLISKIKRLPEEK